MPKENKSRYAILGLLSFMPCSGYDIKKMTDNSLKFFWSENYGHIYPLLKELEEEGLADSKKVDSGKGPSKNVFSLTAKGKKVFESWLKSAESRQRYRIEILLKMFFSSHLSVKEIVAKLEAHICEQEELLEEYKKVEAEFAEIPQKRYRLSAVITLDYGKRHAQMVIQWARECIKTVNSL
ncbi:MAG: PadR family transcriptional regulator [Spirochaetaceae bacterium]|nr:MAG: PadR family transcriptional regulator [Spirochaetaceae bacterium]